MKVAALVNFAVEPQESLGSLGHVALVKPRRGICWNHAINSFRAMLYTRFVIGEETLSRTSIFSFSQWAIFSVATNSFIFRPFNGHYRHLNVTLYSRRTFIEP